MTTKAQSIRVGLFAAATLSLLGVVLVVFGGLRFWEKADRYRIVFATSVIGLEPGAQVYLNGVKVGTVDALGVDAQDLRKVAVTIKVKHDTPIHTDTRAMLQLAGITGLKVIDLRGGSSATAALPPGGEIPAGAATLDKLEAQAQAIVEQSTALMKRANLLTDNLVAVTVAITEPAKLAAENLATTSGSLKAMVDENRVALRQSLVAIRETANGASELLDGQVAQLFVGAGDLVSELKKLLANNEGPLREAVFDLRQASRSFKELARDVRQKPSRLLFSSTPSERKLP
jgi:phospholipid/cholesterol/gamma-HCH transport system substrate-binding protein